MTEARNALPITGFQIPDVDIEAPIRSGETPSCKYYQHDYAGAAVKAEKDTQADLAKLYQSLSIICSFYPNYKDVAEPYRPFVIMNGKRSAVPGDLSEHDLQTIALFLAKATDPALRARLGDILWVRKRDHLAARQAVLDYVVASRRQLTPLKWVNSIELFRRALQLAEVLGRKKESWKAAEKNLLDALSDPLAESAPFYACHLLEIALQMYAGDPMALAKQAGQRAESASAEKDPRRTREYRLLETNFHKASKDVAAEAAARLIAAETYVEDAEACLLRPQPSYLAASHFLAQGIEALRQAKADPERIKELRRRLSDYQRRSLTEMKKVGMELDLTKTAEEVMAFVTTPNLREALKRLAFGMNFIDRAKLRAEVLKSAKDFPFLHIFEQSTVDSEGRVVEKTGSFMDASGPEAEAALEARMFHDAARFKWGIRASAIIEPARMKIWSDHHPQPDDLAFLVRHNPFVPPGHEAIFMRGLFYGLAGDLLLASHLLTPQIENSLRFVLEQSGADVSNLNSDLTQPVKVLGPLFSLPEMKNIFGEDLCFELRGLLIEKTGFSFRNRIAHGFVSEAECYGDAAINVWWLALRLCFTPLAVPEQREPGTEETEAPPKPQS
jgi:hypothetical protein